MVGRKQSMAGASKLKTDPDPVPVEEDVLVMLCRLLEEANLRITFDSQRDFTKPCLDCGTTIEPRTLVDIGWDAARQDEITRPMCFRCAFKRGSTFKRHAFTPTHLEKP